MRRRSRIQRIQADASLAAQRELARMGVNDERPLDIFGLIEEAGIWLMFQPLGRLYGMYRRIGDVAGIVINANHPVPLQRFTAAHEYGHHVLGHDASFDRAEDIEQYKSSRPEQEIAAYAFAATLLMPIQRVNAALRRLGVEPQAGSLDAEMTYRLAQEMGVSYRAAVSQLRILGMINRSCAERLRHERPVEIKTALAGGRPPENPRAEVWMLDERADGKRIYAHPDDEIHLVLQETPTSGYRWTLEPTSTDGPAVEMLGDSLRASDDAGDRYGARHTRHLWLRIREPGDAVLQARLARPWEGPEGGALTEVRAEIHTDPYPTGEADQGLSEHQRPLLLQTA
jgi:Zn-dependent peptidase ImmA (M78 family)/predicted secreted protein